jgi:hypothetical protein
MVPMKPDTRAKLQQIAAEAGVLQGREVLAGR